MWKGLLLGFLLIALAHVPSWFAWDQRPVAQAPDAALPATGIHGELDPGEFAGTLMLGGLRGLATDLLWLRANRAKEAGRFYESVALFQLIAKTQPRFEIVWEYMAWDMAYNIAHEVESSQGKYAWFVAGVEAAAEGAMRNPRGDRIHRYLAWMFLHRGARFPDQVSATDWRPLLAPLFASTGTAMPPPGSSPQRIAAACYRHALANAERAGLEAPAYVRRLIPIALERDGNLARNQGAHREALRRWLRALQAWQEVPNWAEAELAVLERQRGDGEDPPPGWALRRDRLLLSIDSYARNEGQLRRKAAALIRELAPSEEAGAHAADMLMERRFEGLAPIIASPGWKDQAVGVGGVKWYDEVEPDGH